MLNTNYMLLLANIEKESPLSLKKHNQHLILESWWASLMSTTTSSHLSKKKKKIMKCFLPPAKLHMSQSCAQVTHNPAMLQALTCVVPLGWMPSPGRSYPSHLIPMWEALENAALDRFSTCLVVPAFSRLETELLHQIPCSCVVSSCHTMRYHFHFFSSRNSLMSLLQLGLCLCDDPPS